VQVAITLSDIVTKNDIDAVVAEGLGDFLGGSAIVVGVYGAMEQKSGLG
jgi:hypothetical protein